VSPAERRDVSSYDDFRAMQRLTQRAWPRNRRWHVGELAWSRYSGPPSESSGPTSLWADGDRALAWGWVELPGDLSVVVDPDAPELIDVVLEWFDQTAEPGRQSCMALETERQLIDRLRGRGFTSEPTLPYFRYHTRPLDEIAEPVLPDGFQLRHVEQDEAEQRARVHRAGWTDFGSRLSTETYRRVMSAWPYRPELDWVVIAPGGRWAASALGWLDDVNRAGILEPVGCDPAYRRLGLARAVNLACLAAMRDAGATVGLVNPRGDDGYPVPGRLYRSIGFEPGPRTVTYLRHPR
jgi:hypothetical protein